MSTAPNLVGWQAARRCKAAIRALSIYTVVVSAVLFWGLLPGHAHAEHETRTSVLQETGTDVVFLVVVILTIVAAFLAMAVFAAIILRWERTSGENEERGQGHSSGPRR